MHTEILQWLHNQSEEKYRIFSAKLLPSETKLLGVRIPLLRQYAKALIKDGRGAEYLNMDLSILEYQEELMLYALILANIKMPVDEKLSYIKDFLPFINSWAICDIFCGDLKEVRKSQQVFYDTFQALRLSEKEYQIRFFMC